MGNLVDNKFTWVIQNFNPLLSGEIFSNEFVIGGCEWKLCVKNTSRDISLYLSVAGGYESLPRGWKRHAKFSLTFVNQLSEKPSREAVTQKWFHKGTPSQGFDMVLLTRLYERDNGFLVNGQLKITAEVDDLEVIGKLDESEESEQGTTQSLKRRKQDNDVPNKTQQLKETVEVNGFLVLPSQVDSVKRIFGKYPDMAVKCRAKNQTLRTASMNVLLCLIKTLCQSPKKLSEEDLEEADSALAYVMDAGFKVDWLEKRLEEVKEKKKDEQIGETQVQELEEELKDFKQKCSEIEAQLEKEKAKVLAAETSLTLDDFV